MNQEIKQHIKASGVKQWQVADKMGISEYTLVKWLRYELSDERKAAIYAAIESLKKGA